MLTIHNAAFRKIVKYKFFNFLLPYVAAFHCCVSFRFAIGCVILWLSEKFVACRALRIINSGVADPKLAKHVRTGSSFTLDSDPAFLFADVNFYLPPKF